MFYKIVVSNERSSSDVYLANTKEECEKHIMEFADFYCSNGTCSIYEIDNRFEEHRYWRYESGKCVKESSREADIEQLRLRRRYSTYFTISNSKRS